MNKLIIDYVAVDLDDRPSSLVDCLAKDDLILDPLKYCQYQDKEDELGDLILKMLMSYNRKEHLLFSRWIPKNKGQKCSPIELLLLGSLRYLGRGLTFDDLEKYTAIHEETHLQFFHKFIEFASTALFREYVQMPTTVEEYKRSQLQYSD
jgi:hypothetical protein